MKKIILAAILTLTALNTSAETVCVQNALQITLANGIGSNSTSLSNITNTLSSVLTPPTYGLNFEQDDDATVAANTTVFSGPLTGSGLGYNQISQFNNNSSWAGEISLGGKFALGGSMFATLSAGIGANMGFSQATLPVSNYGVQAGVQFTGNPAIGTISGVTPVSTIPSNGQTVTMKSGMGYSIMVGLGKETSFGSASVDLGVVFRSFRFYFPSALGIQSQSVSVVDENNATVGTITPSIGVSSAVNPAIASPISDRNTYGSFYHSYNQTGFRFGGSLSFKIVDNLSFGISAAAELYGNKTFTINPNISSFSANPPANTTASTTSTTDTSSTSSSSSTKASNINNTNMASTAFTATAKNFVTSVMMTLTYSIPVGN